MESWRRVWREAVAPLLTNDHLYTLRRGLQTDDPRLIQGATTTPPGLQCVQSWPVEAACAIGYCLAFADEEPHTVAETSEFFARTCYNIDQTLTEPAGCRHWLNWWDETPRPEVRRLMLPEIELALSQRSPVTQGV